MRRMLLSTEETIRMTTDNNDAWQSNPWDLANLIEWLTARDEAPEDVLYLLRKPWKYAPEYEEMIRERAAEGETT